MRRSDLLDLRWAESAPLRGIHDGMPENLDPAGICCCGACSGALQDRRGKFQQCDGGDASRNSDRNTRS
jgi:hypothetical protein